MRCGLNQLLRALRTGLAILFSERRPGGQTQFGRLKANGNFRPTEAHVHKLHQASSCQFVSFDYSCSTAPIMNRSWRSAWLATFGFGALLIIFISAANATSIVQFSFADLIEKSELVFEGEVITSEARWNQNRTRIFTEVQFRIDEVIKGTSNGNTLSLKFAGGTVGEDRMEVQAMTYPQVGETGIYFVERTDIDMVNPLLGWNQGHFVIKDGQLMTNRNKKVLGVSPVSRTKQTELNISGGEMKGLRTASPLNKGSGIGAEDFKQLIREQIK